MNTHNSFRKVYGHPSILAAITLIGLLFALFGDGFWDVASWIALAIPLLVLASKLAMSSAGTRNRSGNS